MGRHYIALDLNSDRLRKYTALYFIVVVGEARGERVDDDGRWRMDDR